MRIDPYPEPMELRARCGTCGTVNLVYRDVVRPTAVRYCPVCQRRRRHEVLPHLELARPHPDVAPPGWPA